MRRNRWYLVGVAVIAIAAVGYGVQRSNSQPRPDPGATARASNAARSVPVVVADAVGKSFDVNLQVIGTVQAYATVAVKSRVDGQLLTAHFKEGQFVKKGDPLFTIDPRSYEALVKQAEANLTRDRAQAVRAKEDLTRYADLVKKEYSSRQKFEEAKATAAAADATVRADEAMLDNARLNLEYTQILSPIDGRTSNLTINAGNLVKANDTLSIVTITQTHPIYVQFAVAEKYVPVIRRRLTEGDMHVLAVIPSEPDIPEKGKVTFINNAVDIASGTILLRATYENDSDRLVPGQFVNVTLTLDTLPTAVVVPSQAVQTSQDGNFLYVVNSDMSVERRPVNVGPSSNSETVIEKGLKAGEKVVTEGQMRLIAGVKVQIRGAGGAAAGGGAAPPPKSSGGAASPGKNS